MPEQQPYVGRDDHRAERVRDVEMVGSESWDDPVRGSLSFRTLFSREETATSVLTAGVADVAPGGRLEVHRHGAAEVYFVLEGRGLLTLDGDEQEVAAGMAVHIAADAPHGIRNAGDTPLRFFYALAADGMADVDYRFEAAAEGHSPTSGG